MNIIKAFETIYNEIKKSDKHITDICFRIDSPYYNDDNIFEVYVDFNTDYNKFSSVLYVVKGKTTKEIIQKLLQRVGVNEKLDYSIDENEFNVNKFNEILYKKSHRELQNNFDIAFPTIRALTFFVNTESKIVLELWQHTIESVQYCYSDSIIDGIEKLHERLCKE